MVKYVEIYDSFKKFEPSNEPRSSASDDEFYCASQCDEETHDQERGQIFFK